MCMSCGFSGCFHDIHFAFDETQKRQQTEVASYRHRASVPGSAKPIWDQKWSVRKTGDMSIITRDRTGTATVVTHEVLDSSFRNLHGPHRE